LRILFKETLPKEGEDIIENSDAFHSNEQNGGLCVALADGATQGMMTKNWAICLVETACSQKEKMAHKQHLASTIVNARILWKEERDSLVRTKNHSLSASEYTWLYKYGAYSTFLSLRISGSIVEAAAIGDTCLFHVNNNKLLKSFPVTDATKFNDSPTLLGSIALDNIEHEIETLFRFDLGKLKRSSRLYLMTDALAAWFLREYSKPAEKGHLQPWVILDRFVTNNLKSRSANFLKQLGRKNDKESFTQFVKRLRINSEITNDDTTLIILG
jgi:hypothetical protein